MSCVVCAPHQMDDGTWIGLSSPCIVCKPSGQPEIGIHSVAYKRIEPMSLENIRCLICTKPHQEGQRFYEGKCGDCYEKASVEAEQLKAGLSNMPLWRKCQSIDCEANLSPSWQGHFCSGCKDRGPATAVNHPKHYNMGTFEVIDVIEDWQLDFNLGNAVKYIARAPHKGNQLEDLKKAAWYLDRAIKRLECP